MKPKQRTSLPCLLQYALLGIVLAMLTGPALADEFRGVVTGVDYERLIVSIDGRDYRLSGDTKVEHEHDREGDVSSPGLKPNTRVRYRIGPPTSGERPMLIKLIVIDRQ